MGDLKPEPPLWHEDSRRKPWENGRQGPTGTSSGRQLGEAAHRLVANSLQLRADRNGYSDQMHVPPPFYIAPYGQPRSSYQNNSYHDEERNRIEPARTGYPAEAAQGHHRSSNRTVVQNQFDRSYGQPYASSAAHDPYSRSHRQHETDPYNRSYPQYDRDNRSTTQNREHGYYPPGFQQNGGNRYPAHGPPRHVVQTPIPAGAHFHQQGGYNAYGGYQSYGAATYHHGSGSWAPQVDQTVERGYGRPLQSGNQFQALDRGASRKPPPPPRYGR